MGALTKRPLALADLAEIWSFIADDSELAPIENAAMPDRSVTQWDKDDLEAPGLLKVDVLALGMLTAIRRTLDLVRFLVIIRLYAKPKSSSGAVA